MMNKTVLCLTMIFVLLIFGCASNDSENDSGKSEGPAPVDTSPRWGQLHADNARTDSVYTDGIRQEPKLLWEMMDDSPSAFSGPVIGPAHETSLGIGGKIYRVLGPGPISFNPPEGIDMVIGTTSEIQVIDPRNGSVLDTRDLNLGAFTTFASADVDGNVIVPDWGRVQKFSGGLEELVWRYDFGGVFSGFGDVPAGSAGILDEGQIVVGLFSGRILVLDSDSGYLIDDYTLGKLNPPVAADPQFEALGILFRNAVVVDENAVFCLVNGEIIRLRFRTDKQRLRFSDRASTQGFSSSTPTLDTKGKRLFLITYDPNDPESEPELKAFDYGGEKMQLRWAVPTNVDFKESEDQLTVTYLPEQRIIINNSIYGHLSAYRETTVDGSPSAELLWSTRDTIGDKVGAYISSATQPDGALYFVENFSKMLYALDAETGEPLWTWPLPSQSIKTPIPHKGRLYIDHNQGMIALEGPSATK